MADENNYPSDISTDNKSYIGSPGTSLRYQGQSAEFSRLSIEETDIHSSLEVDTGTGSNTVSYPPSIHDEINVSTQNTLTPQHATDASAVKQTSKTRTSSESSGSHSPREVNTPCGSPSSNLQELVTSGKSLDNTNVGENPIRNNNRMASTAIISQQFPNGPVLIKHIREHVRGETALFDNVLPVPNCPSYEGIASSFIDVKQVRYPEFKDAAKRSKSFENWPLSHPSGREMSASTLFYKGRVKHEDGTEDIDLVYCYRCGETLCKFEPGDNPNEEHNRWHPQCAETYYVF